MVGNSYFIQYNTFEILKIKYVLILQSYQFNKILQKPVMLVSKNIYIYIPIFSNHDYKFNVVHMSLKY